MEEWEHAVEVFEEIFEQGHALSLWRKLLEYGSSEKVREYLWFPVHPLVLIHRSRRDHFLERRVASLFIHPLDTLWREDGEAGRGSYLSGQPCLQNISRQNLAPIYRVSPQLFVTSEHIMSESASTSSSDFSEIVLFLLSPFLLFGSGDAKVLRGVEPFPSFGVL